MNTEPELEVLLPVHNEEDSIEWTVREIFDELSPRVRFRFVICEDGSRDNTKKVLETLASEFPIRLVTSDERKGYSRAVIDGMLASTAPYLLCLDSDGQCDPRDFWQFWEAKSPNRVVMGRRVRRRDTPLRLILSRGFYWIYRLLYRVPVSDPSCPFVLTDHATIGRLAPQLGAMDQGLWWEFTARAYRGGVPITELPINHRLRRAGETQVYRLTKLPGIGMRHVRALARIWRETRPGREGRGP